MQVASSAGSTAAIRVAYSLEQASLVTRHAVPAPAQAVQGGVLASVQYVLASRHAIALSSLCDRQSPSIGPFRGAACAAAQAPGPRGRQGAGPARTAAHRAGPHAGAGLCSLAQRGRAHRRVPAGSRGVRDRGPACAPGPDPCCGLCVLRGGKARGAGR